MTLRKVFSKCRPVKNDKGIALIIVLFSLVILTAIGLWLVFESGTELRITGALKSYEQAFNLADGACELAVRCIKTENLNVPWNFSEGEIDVSNISYMNTQSLGNGQITPRVFYKGYSDIPPPGWMFDWKGYSGFYREFYMGKGDSSIQSSGTSNSVIAVVEWIKG